MVRTAVRIETDALRRMWGEDDFPTSHVVKNPSGEWRQDEDGNWTFYRDDETPDE